MLFTGWARMALPPSSFAIVEVRKPNVGEAKPSAVTAEIKFDLATLRAPVRAEWDELRQHDVLFLLVRSCMPPCCSQLGSADASCSQGITPPTNTAAQTVRSQEMRARCAHWRVH